MLSALRLLSPPRRLPVLVSGAVLLLLLAGHAMLETARDALFLTGLSATKLPLAYLAVAALAVAVDRLPISSGGRLTWTLLGGAALTLGLYPLTAAPSELVLFVLYVWPGVLVTAALIQFWVRMHGAFDVGQAKRLFAMLGVGAMGGALLGMTAAAALLERYPPRTLIVVAAGLIGCAGLLVRVMTRPVRAREAPVAVAPERLRDTLRDRYNAKLLGLAATIAVATTLGDYLFKAAVAERLSPGELGSFFARFYAVTYAIAIAIQLLVVPWLLQRGGVQRALFVLPALLSAASLGALTGGLLPLLLLKGTDSALRHSLHATAAEILFLPLRSSARRRIKRLVTTVGDRGGKALGSGLILLVAALPVGGFLVAALAAAMAIGAVVIVAGVHHGYIAEFREKLRRRTVEITEAPPPLTLHALERLVASLGSHREAEVLAATDLLCMYGKQNLVPTLLVHHRSPVVVVRALEALAQVRREELAEAVPALLARNDPRVTAAVLQLVAHEDLERARPLLEAHRDDDDEEVRVTARALLARWDTTTMMRLSTGTPAEQRALARALGAFPVSLAVQTAHRLLQEGGESIYDSIAAGLARRPQLAFIAPLSALLSSPLSRAPARRALVAIGEPALRYLVRLLGDTSLPRRVRRHLPRTISLFDTDDASLALSRALREETDERVTLKLLRGLGRMRQESPRRRIDSRAVRETLWRHVRDASQLLSVRIILGQSQRVIRAATGDKVLLALLDEHIDRQLERIFRLTHVLQPTAEMVMLHDGCLSDDREVRAVSRELLHYLLPRATRRRVMTLLVRREPDAWLSRLGSLEYLPPALRRLHLHSTNGHASASVYVEALRTLAAHHEPAIAAVAAELAREMELRSGRYAAVTPATDSDSGDSLDRLGQERCARKLLDSRSRLTMTETLG